MNSQGRNFTLFLLWSFPSKLLLNTFTNNKIKNRIGQLNLKLEIINKYEFPQTFMQSSFRNIGTELYISLFSLRQKWIHKQGEERERGRQSLQPSSPIERTFTFLQKKIHHLHPLCSDRNYTCSPAASDTAPSDAPRFFPYHRPVSLSFLPSKNTILLLLLLLSGSLLFFNNERGNGRFSGATRLTDSSDNHGESYRPILGATDVSA